MYVDSFTNGIPELIKIWGSSDIQDIICHNVVFDQNNSHESVNGFKLILRTGVKRREALAKVQEMFPEYFI